ncbi:hypothetical protein Cgig2_009618 [Carnegiea gigantea]|uniref:Raptor N-terminal CASPase-like domain-containing protein n=1 Tax=Carnegiea gigantea TaxID=171969 RepID=A0A9Q1JUY8_9CARY|nr:hypothetical protein Cgig2_009618 [Carnegiea gigantea]
MGNALSLFNLPVKKPGTIEPANAISFWPPSPLRGGGGWGWAGGRMKTGMVALVLCLNIGVDPPDVIKISPCARLECWIATPANPNLRSHPGASSLSQCHLISLFPCYFAAILASMASFVLSHSTVVDGVLAIQSFLSSSAQPWAPPLLSFSSPLSSIKDRGISASGSRMEPPGLGFELD